MHWESEARTATTRPPWGRHSLLSVPVGKPHSWLCACRSQQGDSGALGSLPAFRKGLPSLPGPAFLWAHPEQLGLSVHASLEELPRRAARAVPDPQPGAVGAPRDLPRASRGGAELTQTLPQGLPRRRMSWWEGGTRQGSRAPAPQAAGTFELEGTRRPSGPGSSLFSEYIEAQGEQELADPDT